jgi:hypothetical protein
MLKPEMAKHNSRVTHTQSVTGRLSTTPERITSGMSSWLAGRTPTISLDLDTTIARLLKRPNQWRCRLWFRSIAAVRALLMTSFSAGITAAYVFQWSVQ